MEQSNHEILALVMSGLSLACALIPLIITLIKFYVETLKINLCDMIAYDDEKSVIKIINQSHRASANNLNVSFKLINKKSNESYNIKGFNETNQRLYSLNKIQEIGDNEITIKIDVMSINRTSIAKSKDKRIFDLYEKGQLRLLDLLEADEAYLYVEVNALNELTGKTRTFPEKKYYKKDLIQGFFTKGDSNVHQANQITS